MLTLHTFAISHFSEKIRWVLRVAGLPFVEVTLVPGLHMPTTLWLSRRATTVPIITGDGLRVQGSDRILARLGARFDLSAVLPDDPDEHQACLAAAAAHDALGRHVMRWVYRPLVRQPGAMLMMWTLSATPTEAFAIKQLLPVLLPGFERSFGIDDAHGAEARDGISRALDAIDRQRAGADTLGGAFTVEDLSVCALLAPLAAPAAHPIYAHPTVRALMAEAIAPWERHPTLQWVREVYARHRPLEPQQSPLMLAAARIPPRR